MDTPRRLPEVGRLYIVPPTATNTRNKEHTMLKKIALAGIFAVVSIVSFSSSAVNAAKPSNHNVPSVGAPVMKGLCPSMHC